MAVMPMRPDGGNRTAPRAATNTTIGRPAPPVSTPPPRIASNSKGSYVRSTAPPVETAGPIQNIDQYLAGDSDYQNQVRQLAAALGLFNADVTRRRGSIESESGLSEKALGDQRGKDLSELEDNYASRGLIRSGLYGDAVGDYETEHSKRIADIARRRTEAMSGIEQEQGQYSSQQSLQEQEARAAAIRRRAEKLGV